MNGAQLLIKCLEAEGVEAIWGYPGGAIMPTYDALVDSPIRHYLTRHEQGAGFAAQGYARATGNVGVCMATSGPGATNLVTAIADAYMDSVPIVCITGQVPTPLIGTDAFQEIDTFGVTMPIVKHSYLIRNPDDIPTTVRQAFKLAREGRPGPVLIDFPKDVSLTQTAAEPVVRPPANDPPAPPIDQLRTANKLLTSAARPVIYAGGGISLADAVSEFRRFVETTRIPVVHTLKGLGALPADHELFLGMIGMHGLKAANMAVQSCDLLICIGARFDDRATGKLSAFAPNAKVIHMDIDPAEVGKLRVPQAPVVGNLCTALRAMALPTDIDPWREQCMAWKHEHAWNYDTPFDSIYAPRMLRDLSHAAGNNTFITCDVGQHQMWVAQHYRFQRPEQHLTSGGLGTMGFGLPAAIGVQTMKPDATVICVSGDGSIMMNIQELATIKRYDLPIKILLFDNTALGMVRQWQELFFHGRESEIDLSDNPDFSAVAQSFNIPSAMIDHENQVYSAINTLLNTPGPFLLHVKIDRMANVWPLVPPGASNANMLDNPSQDKAKSSSRVPLLHNHS